jgi:hypothetical protein
MNGIPVFFFMIFLWFALVHSILIRSILVRQSLVHCGEDHEESQPRIDDRRQAF